MNTRHEVSDRTCIVCGARGRLSVTGGEIVSCSNCESEWRLEHDAELRRQVMAEVKEDFLLAEEEV